MSTGYELSRAWFDWCFENPEKISPNHSALYFFCIEQCNRLGWKEKFGLPTTLAKDAIGIRSYNTYINTLNDLVDFGFIKMIEKSKNQYSANIVALSKFNKAPNKALDNAFINLVTTHIPKRSESTGESISSIDKQDNNKTKEPTGFDLFWDLYDKKNDKPKSQQKWNKLTKEEKEQIMIFIPKYKIAQSDKKYRKDPCTFLNNRSWENELIYSEPPKIEDHPNFNQTIQSQIETCNESNIPLNANHLEYLKATGQE